jgi:hypothetical protein
MKSIIPDFASGVLNSKRATTTGADVPGAPQGHHAGTDTTTMTPNEKEAIPRSSSSLDHSSDDDDSLEKIDTTAEHGVQAVQAMTQTWTKRDILAAYIM